MTITQVRERFWELRDSKELNDEDVYVDTLHAVLDGDGETVIGAEIFDGRKKIMAFPPDFKRLYKKNLV